MTGSGRIQPENGRVASPDQLSSDWLRKGPAASNRARSGNNRLGLGNCPQTDSYLRSRTDGASWSGVSG